MWGWGWVTVVYREGYTYKCIRLLAFRREIDMGYSMARRCCGSMLSVFALPRVVLRVTFAVEGVKRTRSR